MIWDFLSDYYDVFENICNGRVNRLLCKRVARRMSPGDEVIVPTYLVGQRRSMARAVVNVVNMFSPTFRLQFDADSYRQFFEGMGYDASFELVDGRMPCAIALLKK